MVSEISLTKITELNTWREKKVNIYREERKEKAGSLSHNTLCHCQSAYKYEVSMLYSCGDIFDEKYGEKEK